MTREEIYKLIKYLEKKYHVECEYLVHNNCGMEEIVIRSTLHTHYAEPSKVPFQQAQDVIINKLDKLDLIRF